MHRPLYALFIQQKQVFHCLTTRLPSGSSVFVMTHPTLGLVSVKEAEEKEPFLKSPGASQSGAEPGARTGGVVPPSRLSCSPHWPALFPHGEPGIPCLSWSFLVPWVSLSSTPGSLAQMAGGSCQTHESASRQT